jgi:hypothetical protein
MKTKYLLILLFLLAQNIYAGPKTRTCKISTRGGRTVRETCQITRTLRRPNRKVKTIKETCSNLREFKTSNTRAFKTIEDPFADVLK